MSWSCQDQGALSEIETKTMILAVYLIKSETGILVGRSIKTEAEIVTVWIMPQGLWLCVGLRLKQVFRICVGHANSCKHDKHM